MGQKVNPHGFRVGVNQDWDSRWIAKKKNFADYLIEDDKIRKFLKNKLYAAGISKIETERAANKVSVNIYTGRPGIVIGKGGAGVEVIKNELKKLTGGKQVLVNIIDVNGVDTDAQLVAENIAAQLEKRISFRRAMKQAISRTMKAGAYGIKIVCSGRLGGAEIARSEEYHEGSIPLQTIRADIDYGFSESRTTYGRIGVKVWIYKGEILDNPLKERSKPKPPTDPFKDRRRSGMPVEGGKRNVNAKKG